ncbi:MAG: cytidylate kinase family protein [Clostridia bacterium]
MMFITITGQLGSGKSTVCRILNEKYDFSVFTTGIILRNLSKKQGMTALEFNEYITREKNNVDDLIDNETKRIAEEKLNEKVVFDSRMAWFFVPKSLKVYLKVDSYVAAVRVFKGGYRIGEEYETVTQAQQALLVRSSFERERFLKLYNADLIDMKNYDLIIDTTDISAEKVAEKIILALQNQKISD